MVSEKVKEIKEALEQQRVSIAESFVRENQLKDRITENIRAKFKDKLKENVNGNNVDIFITCLKLLDEVIKECVDKKRREESE